MTSDLDSGGESSIELRHRRIFRVRLWVGTGCYLLASFALYQWGHEASPWRLVWAVLPLLFMAWNVIAIALRVRQMDEYQVKPNAGWPVALIGIVAWEVTNLATGAPKG
jgi:hypothetical protein